MLLLVQIALLALTACTDRAGPGQTDSTSGDSADPTGVDTGTRPGDPGPPSVCINEIMEDNRDALTDDNGGTPSWIELHNPDRVDLDLDGWSLTDDAADPTRHVFGAGSVVPALGFLVLFADDQTDLGPEHVAFELHRIGGTLTLFTPDGDALDTGSWIDEWDAAMARARDSDCCQDLLCWSSVPQGTPGATNVLPQVEDVPLVSAESTWRFLDSGQAPGSSWRSADFDDSGWDSGPGPLGYGDDHQRTELSYGGNGNDKHPTTWFRRELQVADAAALDGLRLELLYDDGAAVSLNGVEILRAGLPDGALTADTYASRTASGSGETDYTAFSASAEALVDGTNVLAVEVHQAAPDSSDLGFDLAVIGEILQRPR